MDCEEVAFQGRRAWGASRRFARPMGGGSRRLPSICLRVKGGLFVFIGWEMAGMTSIHQARLNRFPLPIQEQNSTIWTLEGGFEKGDFKRGEMLLGRKWRNGVRNLRGEMPRKRTGAGRASRGRQGPVPRRWHRTTHESAPHIRRHIRLAMAAPSPHSQPVRCLRRRMLPAKRRTGWWSVRPLPPFARAAVEMRVSTEQSLPNQSPSTTP